MAQGFTRGVPIDTDPTLANNSNLLVPSQYAVVQYVANQLSTIGGVSAVTASTPLASTGGATPNISITQASPITDGYITAADYVAFSSGGGGVTKGFVIAMAVAL
jgi:hypothetical protein